MALVPWHGAQDFGPLGAVYNLGRTLYNGYNSFMTGYEGMRAAGRGYQTLRARAAQARREFEAAATEAKAQLDAAAERNGAFFRNALIKAKRAVEAREKSKALVPYVHGLSFARTIRRMPSRLPIRGIKLAPRINVPGAGSVMRRRFFSRRRRFIRRRRLRRVRL